MPAATTIPLSGDQDTDPLLSGVAWAVSSLTYSFPDSAAFYGFSYSYDREPQNNFEALNPAQKATARSALGMYAAVAGLTFTELTESASVHADLRMAESDDPSTAWGYYPHGSAAGGDSWYNNSRGRYDAPVKGSYAFHTFVHELGHNLGLEHGHDAGDGMAMTAAHDSMEYSVMTYRSYQGQTVLGGYTNEPFGYAQSPMMYDIAAVQHMYGANYASNAGATTYSWDPATGEAFVDSAGQGAPGANRVFMTVWDGGGTDTYDFSNYATSIAADLRPGAWSTLSQSQRAYLGNGNYAAGNVANALLHEGDLRSIIENLRGGSAADVLIGNQVGNVLDGGGGDDMLDAGAGVDALWGGEGTDTFRASLGLDAIDGGAGADTLDLSALGSAVFLSMVATDGSGAWISPTAQWRGATDKIAQLSSVENVVTTAYGDYMRGDERDNVFIYTAGLMDEIDARQGQDTLDFSRVGTSVQALVDQYRAFDPQSGSNYAYFWDIENIVGSAQADTLRGNWAANRLVGGAGNDTLVGLAGDDTLEGGEGNDVFYVGTGRDVVDGGAGADTLDLSGLGSAVFLSMVATDGSGAWISPTAQWRGATDKIAQLSSVENVVTTAYGDYMRGDDRDNVFIYTPGLMDEIDARQGQDTLDFSRVGTAVHVLVDQYRAFDPQSGSTHAYFWDIENIVGSAQADTLRGNWAANRLVGGAGNDTLTGMGGDDTLEGGEGNDVFYVGTGRDVVEGGAGADTLDLSGLGSAVFLSMVASDGSGAWLSPTAQWRGATDKIAQLSSVENVVTTAYGDYMRGDDRDNVFIYTPGLMDEFDAKQGQDTLDFSRVGTSVHVQVDQYRAFDPQSGSNYAYFWDIENIVGSAQADTLRGNWAANRLVGGAGNDTLVGLAGDDTLEGGSGVDALSGGAGSDTFRYTTLTDSVDTIADFASGSSGDVLDIRSILQGYTRGVSSISAYVQLEQSGGDTRVAVNADGSGSDFVNLALLQGVTGLLLNDMLAQGNLAVG